MFLKPVEFGRILGLKSNAVSNLIKRGRIKKTNNGLINLNDDFTIAYLKKKKIYDKIRKLTAKDIGNAPQSKKPIKKNEISAVNKIKEKILEMPEIKVIGKIDDTLFSKTAQELIQHYGSHTLAKNSLEVEKLRLETTLKNLQLREKNGELVKKELVEQYINVYLDTLNKNILNFPNQFVDNIIAVSKKKPDIIRQSMLNLLITNISTMIKNTKLETILKLSELTKLDKSKNSTDANSLD